MDKFVLVFLDDNLIYSNNEEENEEHLRLTLIREHKLYAKLRKSDFYKDKIHYLGHIISEEGIYVDPEKIEVIMNWLTPRHVSDVRYFMGLAGYYNRFIEGFSKVAHPINSLQRKGIEFEWTPRCEESFRQLKDLLTSSPVLKIADPEKVFVVCIDACGQGLGGVLMQDNHVICYELRKLKAHERNYATHDLELATIVHALKMWRLTLWAGYFS